MVLSYTQFLKGWSNKCGVSIWFTSLIIGWSRKSDTGKNLQLMLLLSFHWNSIRNFVSKVWKHLRYSRSCIAWNIFFFYLMLNYPYSLTSLITVHGKKGVGDKNVYSCFLLNWVYCFENFRYFCSNTTRLTVFYKVILE